MKTLVRNYILNYFIFPLLVVCNMAVMYIYSGHNGPETMLLPAALHMVTVSLLFLICTVVVFSLGHLAGTISQLERLRNGQLIASVGEATRKKIYNIFLESEKSSPEQEYNGRRYYLASVLQMAAGMAIPVMLLYLLRRNAAGSWPFDTLRLLAVLNAVACWVLFNLFRKKMEQSLRTIKRFSDRCMYYAIEDLKRSQIFNTITDVVKIFNDEQNLTPVLEKVISDCVQLLALDVGVMEVFLDDTKYNMHRVVVPTPTAITLDEYFHEFVAGRSEVHNNLELSRLFKPIGEQGFYSMVHVALEVRGGEVGYMAGFCRERRDLRDSDLGFFYTFGRQASMIIENAYLLEKVKVLSVTDGLTGLHNHRYFKEAIIAETRRAVRYNKSLCVVMIDIDHFKHYNDTNGHPAGDRVLLKVAKILTGMTRDTDIVARYGGEEFVLVLTETHKEGGTEFARRLCRAVEREEFENEQAQPGGMLTISVGVAACRDDSTDPQELINFADKALYRAKHEGRNRVAVHNVE